MTRSFLTMLAIIAGGLVFLLLLPFAARIGTTVYLWRSSHYQKGWESLDYQYDVSPSGDAIVFVGEGDGGRDLYIFDISSRQIRRLTHSKGFEHEVRFLDEHTVVTSVVETPSHPLSPKHLYLLDTRNGSSKQITDGEHIYDGNPLPISPYQILFARSEIDYAMKPWGMEVEGSVPCWYIMDVRTENALPLHAQNFDLNDAFVNAVFSNGRKLLETSIIGDRNDLFLRYLSGPLESLSVRSERRMRLTRNGRDGCISPDEKHVFYLSDDTVEGGSSIMRLNLVSHQATRLLKRGYVLKSLCVRNQWLFFLEGSGKDVTLWRMDIRGKRLEKLLSPAQFANPLGR